MTFVSFAVEEIQNKGKVFYVISSIGKCEK